ncbi:MAG: MBL fold metallo-hydrolase [Congregibacter sp.]|nr:MBL fold metallo-hydrolase [Congregibacter sp.]
MRLASLGSGSKGNATLVQLGDQLFLVDCGFSTRQVAMRLARLGVSPGDITGLLVTHEHSDHIRGVQTLAHKFNIPVYASHGTLKAMQFPFAASGFDSHESFAIGNVQIVPVAVPHDAREPTAFVFVHDGVKIGVLSDLGHVTPHVISSFQDCDLLLMESNHDLGMLRSGRYPPSLQRRVGGLHGHLNNEQAIELLEAIGHARLRVVIGHVSEANNDLDILRRSFASFRTRVASIEIASQSEGISWQTAGDWVSPLAMPQ